MSYFFSMLPNDVLGSGKQTLSDLSNEISMVTAKGKECVIREKTTNTNVKMSIPPGSTCFPAK